MSQAFIPQEILDEIAAKCDIVSVVGEYVPLKRTGANYTGLCPFHNEKTPSFTVSPAKQIFYCFGCGEGGNVFKFMMKIENLTFQEAVAKLAEKCGVCLPEKEMSRAEKERLARLERLYKINDVTARYYQKVLLETNAGKPYLEYLLKRGLSREIIEKFTLGAAPESWDNLTGFLRKKGIKDEEMLDLGLASRGKDGRRVFDRFRGRAMFPIRDERGRVIAFGGRLNDPEAKAQKYMNSPETPLFHKGRVLYGLDMAKNAMRSEDAALLVEGYMDVIACHQYGITNVVAPLGTAFTPEQAKLLLRNTYRVYVSFDGDAAGEKAAMRSLDIFSDLGLNVHVLTLPGGRDPDEYLRAFGKEAFLKEMADSPEYLMYKASRLMEKINVNDITGKSRIIRALADDLHKIKSPVALESAVTMLSHKLQLGEQAIMQELRQKKPEEKFAAPPETVEKSIESAPKINFNDAYQMAQVIVLNGIYKEPSRQALLAKTGGEDLFDEPFRKLYQTLVRQSTAEEELLGTDASLLAQVIFLAEKETAESAEPLLYEQALNRLVLRQTENAYSGLLSRLAQAENSKDQSLSIKLLQELEQVRKKKEKLENKARGMK